MLEANELKLVSSPLQESNHQLDLEECVTITVIYLTKTEYLVLLLGVMKPTNSVIAKKYPTSPLHTQIPVDMRCSCCI